MTDAERAILEALDAQLQLDPVRKAIEPVVERVERKLEADPSVVMAWEPLPLTIYPQGVPSFIRSSWVFILRAGATTGAERHPNSQQRMMSYRGTGDMQTGGPGQWKSHPLVSSRDADWEKRWISIPTNDWHQCVVPGPNWVVVSFQTVSAHELIEERPDSTASGGTKQKFYVNADPQG
jgi:hypothetical protein